MWKWKSTRQKEDEDESEHEYEDEYELTCDQWRHDHGHDDGGMMEWKTAVEVDIAVNSTMSMP